jgi:heptosyltransferase III
MPLSKVVGIDFSLPLKVPSAFRLLHACVIRMSRQIFHFVVVTLYSIAHLTELALLAHKIRLKGPKRNIIAVVLLEHFGDIVACEPTIRYLRSKYPDSYIIWFTSHRYSELLRYNPNVNKVVMLYCLTEWILLSHFNLFDAVYNLHANERACPVCDILLRKKKGKTSITIRNYYNYGSLLSSFAQSAGLPSLNDGPKVYSSDRVIRSVDLLCLPRELIVIHCTSNEKARDWLSDKWDELVDRLTNSFDIHLAEVGLVPTITKGLPRYFNLCGKLSLLETAEVIRRARLFIGIDSGPAHLANAVGTRGVVLLGHYRIFRSYVPFSGGYADGSSAELLRHDGPVAEMPVERVFQAAKAGLDPKSVP